MNSCHWLPIAVTVVENMPISPFFVFFSRWRPGRYLQINKKRNIRYISTPTLFVFFLCALPWAITGFSYISSVPHCTWERMKTSPQEGQMKIHGRDRRCTCLVLGCISFQGMLGCTALTEWLGSLHYRVLFCPSNSIRDNLCSEQDTIHKVCCQELGN